MDPAALEPAGPTDREIRTRGALVAAAISFVWLLAGLALCLVAPAMLGLVVVLLTPPLAIAAGLGWLFGPKAGAATRRRGLVAGMSVLVVALNDAAVSLCYAMLQVTTYGNVRSGLEFLEGIAVWFLIYFLYGILFFGLPGLLLAVPSAFAWTNVMRGTFRTPVPAGGDRGSDGRRR